MKESYQSKKKIKEVERLLTEVKDRLKTLGKESQYQQKNIHTERPLPLEEELQVGYEKKIQIEETLPSEEELQAEYERLYEEFIVKNPKTIEEFIKGKSKIYLKGFCKANSLLIDATKVSKDRILNEVIQCMVQRKAITKKVT